MRMHRSLCLLAALAATWPALSAAQDKPAVGASAARRAEDLAAQAYDLYGKGQFAEAVVLYQKAYELNAAAPILFNIANIFDKKLHDGPKAAEHYRRYLASSGTEPALVKRAGERLQALEEEAAARAKPPAPPPPIAPPSDVAKEKEGPVAPAPPAQGAGSLMRVLGFTAGGIGIAGLVVGGVAGAVAMSRNNQAGKSCNGAACTDPAAITLTADARTAAAVSTGGFVAGGILLAGGATLLILAPRSPQGAASLQLAPALGPGHAGLVFAGTFR